jgi:hypothetical protein
MGAKTHVGLYVNCPLLLSYINQNWRDVSINFGKLYNSRFCENSFIGSQAVACGYMNGDSEAIRQILQLLF